MLMILQKNQELKKEIEILKEEIKYIQRDYKEKISEAEASKLEAIKNLQEAKGDKVVFRISVEDLVGVLSRQTYKKDQEGQSFFV